MSPDHTDWLNQFDMQSENQQLHQDYKEMMIALIENPKNKHFEKMLFKRMLSLIHHRNIAPSDQISMQGCCTPGNGRLFVSTNGNLHMCDRNCGDSYFGTIFHLDEIPEISKSKIMHYYAQSKNSCQSCWASKFCQSCFATAGNGTDDYSNYFGKSCNINKDYITDMLILYVSIREKDDHLLEYLLT